MFENSMLNLKKSSTYLTIDVDTVHTFRQSE